LDFSIVAGVFIWSAVLQKIGGLKIGFKGAKMNKKAS